MSDELLETMAHMTAGERAMDQQVAMTATPQDEARGHVIYKTGDVDAPTEIKDRNGDVVLACCRLCGRGEAQLVEPCDGMRPLGDAQPPQPTGDVWERDIECLALRSLAKHERAHKGNDALASLIESACDEIDRLNNIRQDLETLCNDESSRCQDISIMLETERKATREANSRIAASEQKLARLQTLLRGFKYENDTVMVSAVRKAISPEAVER